MNNEHDLAQLLLDDSQTWQIHNCKLIKKSCHSDGKLPFIYHYDRLPAELKQQFPLTGQLLLNFNQPMTAEQACQLIGIKKTVIASPKYVKITGSIVIINEPLQLAIRLHWSNTSKKEEAIYCKNEQQAIAQAIQKWQFIGRVDTLYKLKQQNFPTIIGGYDVLASSAEDSHYALPMSDKKLDWIKQTIVDRVS